MFNLEYIYLPNCQNMTIDVKIKSIYNHGIIHQSYNARIHKVGRHS